MARTIHRPSPAPFYGPRKGLESNQVIARTTQDPKVLQLVPRRRWVRWGGTTLPCARQAAA